MPGKQARQTRVKERCLAFSWQGLPGSNGSIHMDTLKNKKIKRGENFGITGGIELRSSSVWGYFSHSSCQKGIVHFLLDFGEANKRVENNALAYSQNHRNSAARIVGS